MSRAETKLLVVIPVFNEEVRLPSSVPRLLAYLQASCGFNYQVVIAENGSTDGTLAIASFLATQYPRLSVFHVAEKGRGRALKQVWGQSRADVLSYMDVDLSADLSAFIPMLQNLLDRDFDLATGSRLLPGATTKRCWKRTFLSRAYNNLIKALFHPRFSDAQCGFKAITQRAALRLLPVIEDNGWFFDTELLVLAGCLGYQILDTPVTWTEAAGSRVRILSTAWADCKGLLRLRRNLAGGRYAHLKLAPRASSDALNHQAHSSRAGSADQAGLQSLRFECHILRNSKQMDKTRGPI